MPGGGTTDYAVMIFYEALQQGAYTCYLSSDVKLDMMYMPDALNAIVNLCEADGAKLRHRNAYNITSMSITPEDLAASIRNHMPAFKLLYDVDPVREAIARSWPDQLDDHFAREDWAWSPTYDLEAMTADMLQQLRIKLQK
jgi:nucleoside-diphosphate-sugar epimerase